MSNSILEIRAHVTRRVHAAIFDCVVAPYTWNLPYEVQVAAMCGDLNIVKYLREIGACTCADEDNALYTAAAAYDHLHIVKYLVSVGATVYDNNKYADYMVYKCMIDMSCAPAPIKMS